MKGPDCDYDTSEHIPRHLCHRYSVNVNQWWRDKILENNCMI